MTSTAATFCVCLYFVVGFAFNSAVVLESRYSPSRQSTTKLEDGYEIHLYSYTPEGWDNETIDESILKINLDYLEERGPKPDNASARDTIFVYADFSFTTTEVINDRSLAVLLSQRIPAVNNETVPCEIASTDPKDLVVQRLSCIAMNEYIYLVAGLLEGVPCTEGEPCRDDGLKVYSTAIVFDKQGYLVAKYRKYNLINEEAIDKPSTLEPATFTTESGITQGIFMSHDLLFAEPANTYFANGVRRFVDLGATVNTMPFGFSLSVHWGWHFANRDKKIALATSNYQNSMLGYTGNGIIWPSGSYALLYGPGAGGFGVLQTGVTDYTKTTTQGESKINGPITSEETDFTDYSSVPVPHSSLSVNEVSVCHGEDEFCCTLTYRTIRNADEMFYQLVAFDGNRTSRDGSVLFPEQTCGLVACSSADKMSCGASLEATNYTQEVSFTVLSLKGSFSSDKVIPITMDAEKYFPMSEISMTVLQNGSRFDVNLVSEASIQTMKTFAISSTDFITKSGAKHISASMMLIAISFYILSSFL
ncbi:pantetheinase-like [Cloeon dipterum]|uniref:pantetheinase-like n=1 Tax=Cloeon dipterum TaxID=197152 RepID=UPI00322094FA